MCIAVGGYISYRWSIQLKVFIIFIFLSACSINCRELDVGVSNYIILYAASVTCPRGWCQRQDGSNFAASLGYTAFLQLAWATQQDLVSKIIWELSISPLISVILTHFALMFGMCSCSIILSSQWISRLLLLLFYKISDNFFFLQWGQL